MSCEQVEPDSSTGCGSVTGYHLSESPSTPTSSGRPKSRLHGTRHDGPKVRHRRVKANARERNRMHGLNHALEELRKHIPLVNYHHQRLSKIETLRLARNYIAVLTKSLQESGAPSNMDCAKTLAAGMSQTTANLIASTFQVHPRVLMHDMQPSCSTAMHAGMPYTPSPDPTSEVADAQFLIASPETPGAINPGMQIQSCNPPQVTMQVPPPLQHIPDCSTSGMPVFDTGFVSVAAEPYPAAPDFYPLPAGNLEPAYDCYYVG